MYSAINSEDAEALGHFHCNCPKNWLPNVQQSVKSMCKCCYLQYILRSEESLVIFTRNSLLHSLNQSIVEMILEMHKVLAVILHGDTYGVHCVAAADPTSSTQSRRWGDILLTDDRQRCMSETNATHPGGQYTYWKEMTLEGDDTCSRTGAVNHCHKIDARFWSVCHTVWRQIFTSAGFWSRIETALFMCWKPARTAFSDWLIDLFTSVLLLFGIFEFEDQLGI